MEETYIHFLEKETNLKRIYNYFEKNNVKETVENSVILRAEWD